MTATPTFSRVWSSELCSTELAAGDGSSTWTISFDVTANTTTAVREGKIEVTIGGIKKTVNVSQAALSVYVDDPNPLSFTDLPAIGKTGNTFTITTNYPDEDITVTTYASSMITNLDKKRTVQDEANGIYLWTITFDVTANPYTSARSGWIDVNVNEKMKYINVSQVAAYVSDPDPASFIDLPAGGKTGNTFTIQTNSPSEDITMHTAYYSPWITNLDKKRTVQDEANGIYLWTITFDVAANPDTSVRSTRIDVNINGETIKYINVSQVAAYISDPVPASFVDFPVDGKMDNTFTITTNAPDITVTTNVPSMITNLNKERGTVADDGSSTWTVTFDVTANTAILSRTGFIKIATGYITKTVDVSQAHVIVGSPSPNEFAGLAASGATNNTFTIETNSIAMTPVLTTTDPLMITNLDAKRTVQDAIHSIYVWTVTFDVSANSTLALRSATISITIDRFSLTVRVSQLASTWSLPPTDMHDGLTNCYMVTPGGSVSIPITRAITISGLDASATATVETLWDDNAVISSNPTLSGSGELRTVDVRVSSKQGNAVIALKDAAGTIRWSWHIWVTDYTGAATWTNNGYTFMDRNLGATDDRLSLSSWGLFYQWGRKDPFYGYRDGTAGYAARSKFKGMADAGSTARVSTKPGTDILEFIQNPATFYNSRAYGYPRLWNTSSYQKSIYDPCPHGWRVPNRKSYMAENDYDVFSPWAGYISDMYLQLPGKPSITYILFDTSCWPITGIRSAAMTGHATVACYWTSDMLGANLHLTVNYTPIFNDSRYQAGEIAASVRCVKE
jgi:hypothetical protein